MDYYIEPSLLSAGFGRVAGETAARAQAAARRAGTGKDGGGLPEPADLSFGRRVGVDRRRPGAPHDRQPRVRGAGVPSRDERKDRIAPLAAPPRGAFRRHPGGRGRRRVWELGARAKKRVRALRKTGSPAGFYPHAESLRTRVLAECERAESIGFGGSLSIQDLGIFEALEGKGKRLLDHGRVPSEKKAETRLRQPTSRPVLTA